MTIHGWKKSPLKRGGGSDEWGKEIRVGVGLVVPVTWDVIVVAGVVVVVVPVSHILAGVVGKSTMVVIAAIVRDMEVVMSVTVTVTVTVAEVTPALSEGEVEIAFSGLGFLGGREREQRNGDRRDSE
jgi:hypothetical protein